MFCPNCGEEIREESAQFCPKCGRPVRTAASQEPEAEEVKDEVKEEVSSKPSEEPEGAGKFNIRKLPKFLIPVILAAVVVIIIIAVVVSAGNRINLNNYVTVEFDGYDGYGTAEANFDWAALSKKYDKKIKMSQSDWGWLYGSFSELLSDCVYMSVDPTSGLSNGDEVTLTWDVDTEDIEYFTNKNVKISAKTETYKVSGLEEVESFDAFAGVSVEFSGVSPNATASVVTDGYVSDQLDFVLSQDNGLSIGDTVTVSISEASANSYMQEYGLYPEEMEKEFVVGNVAYYVSSLEEIPADGMEKLKSQAEDVFRSSAASWDKNAKLNSVDYLGCYFLYEKPGGGKSALNIIYMVYEPHATQYGKEEDGSQTATDVDYYWYIRFYNGMVLDDGTFTIDYSDYSAPSYNSWTGAEGFSVVTYDYTEKNSWSQVITLHYSGYENLDSMFNNLVAEKIDSYTYESTVSGTPAGGSASSDTADAEEGGEAVTGDYLCSFSSERLITDTDLEAIKASDYGTLPADRSLEQMIINEIYAKHGYKFTTDEIQEYFDQKDWYADIGTYESDMSVIESKLSDVEKQNVDFLSEIT